MAPTVVLITGTNRGIGNGILKVYLQRPNHIVIGANRDPNHPTSRALHDLPRAEGTSLVLVKIEATSPTDPVEALKELGLKGIHYVDILVANAGIALRWDKVKDAKVEDIQRHFDVNVHGFIYLYQAFRGLLEKSVNPKWVTIGSGAACLTTLISSYRNFIPVQNAVYAPSKAVQHWYTKAISVEDPWLTAFPVDPGWVASDLGNRGANLLGLERAPVSVEDSATGVVKIIDAATKETHSGKLFKHDGKEEPW
ncbi:hypothetical protein BDV06DRAFT_234055 [Aspergillus oleicola]